MGRDKTKHDERPMPHCENFRADSPFKRHWGARKCRIKGHYEDFSGRRKGGVGSYINVSALPLNSAGMKSPPHWPRWNGEGYRTRDTRLDRSDAIKARDRAPARQA